MKKNTYLTDQFTKFLRKNWQTLLEISTLIFFALWVGREYLNFDPNSYIEGGEFVLTTISHYVWGLLSQCGTCVYWNGYVNGGAPAFIELHGAVLHPLVIITTLLWGVVNGSKVVILISLVTVGLSQWWLAKEINLGFVPRVWAGMMAIAGGHVFGRLQAGNVVLVLSIVSASLILPMILRFKKETSAKNTALLAIVLALTWLSGQGYIQLIVIMAVFPAVLWYLAKNTKPSFSKWKPFIFGVLLSIVLISILAVPFLHFQNNWQKFLSTEMDSVQPMGYSVLNLVIHDWKFFDNTSLEKTISPWAHINYIGWLPILLALLGLVFLHNSSRKSELILSYIAAVLVLFFSSSDPYVLFANWEAVTQLRSLNVAASIAIQPLIFIAAIILQELIERKWLNIEIVIKAGDFSTKVFPLKWIVLFIIVFISIKGPYEYGNRYLTIRPISIPESELMLLDTKSAQWVGPLNYDWIPTLISRNKKLVIKDRPWSWKGRKGVKPLLEVVDNQNGIQIPGTIDTLGKLDLIADENQEYAMVNNGGKPVPCSAKSLGGQIDVTCELERDGVLQVREFYWTGWYAWMDGKQIESDTTKDYLTVPASAGKHIYSFRYRPWDVYTGMGLSLAGLMICIVLLVKRNRIRTENPKNESSESGRI